VASGTITVPLPSGLISILAPSGGTPRSTPSPTVAAREAASREWARTSGAAGKIHSDFARGFICAETIAYDDYVACNGENGAKEAAKMRKEGRGYIVKDGDVILFRFNV